MQDIHPSADARIDAAGEACGTLTPAIRQALAGLAPGQVLDVLAHDPAARVGVPAWCRLTGHELLQTENRSETQTRFLIRKAFRQI